VIMIQFVYD